MKDSRLHYEDAIGSVGFHPLHPLLLSVSGSRHFDQTRNDDMSSESDEEDEAEDERDQESKTSSIAGVPFALDNSVKLWQADSSLTIHDQCIES
jgi:telomerase Cajal body protein 1